MRAPFTDVYQPERMQPSDIRAVEAALQAAHMRVCAVLLGSRPTDILDLVEADFSREIASRLTEREWRLIRFALEKSIDSI